MKNIKDIKKKDRYFKEYFDKQKRNISFITIREGAPIKLKEKEYISTRELPLPVRVNSLIENVKKQKETDDITIGNILDGIIFVLGTDEDFEYSRDYKNILEKLEFELRPYIIYSINQFGEDKVDDAIIYAKTLINIKEDERSCFIYASALEKKALEIKEGFNEKEKIYLMDEAHAYYEKALNYNERFALSYYKLGYYYKLKQQYVKAQLFWQKHQELEQDPIRTEEIRIELEALQPYVDFEKGYNLVLNERSEEGLDLLLPLVKDYSGWWNLLFFIGLAYRSLNEYSLAEKYFENVLKISELQKEAINELGLCKICLEKYKEAQELFTTLLNIEPGVCEVFCNRAVSFLYDNQIEKAKDDIKTALKIDPRDEVALAIKRQIEQM